jgi:hypothetical protein
VGWIEKRSCGFDSVLELEVVPERKGSATFESLIKLVGSIT